MKPVRATSMPSIAHQAPPRLRWCDVLSRSGGRRFLWACCALAGTALSPFSIAGAATFIGQIVIPTAASQPNDITHGPDGNMWFVESAGNNIGRVTADNAITEFPIPTAASQPSVMTEGPDGNLWFTEQSGNKIGRITTAGAIVEFPLPNAASGPQFITVGPDGNLWFTERTGNRIGRITTAGEIAEFPVPTGSSTPIRIVPGPDGNLWFLEFAGNKVAKITLAGAITEFAIPTGSSQPQHIVNGSDGNLWFVEQAGNRIGRITPAGSITEFPLPTASSAPTRLVLGRDGNIWFTESAGNKIANITPAGSITEFAVPTSGSQPNRINRARDANLWFSESAGNKLGRITYSGVITEFPLSVPSATVVQMTTGYDGNLWFVGQGNAAVAGSSAIIGHVVDDAFNVQTLAAAVLPGSRSVQVGAMATAFATIINAGATTAQQCAINDLLSGLPFSEDPETFTYQTTDPATNAVTGSPNTPVDIPAGKAQTFVIAFATSGPFVPDDIHLNFSCAGVGSVPFIVGVNTLLLSASAAAVPDIIALGATPSGNGIVSLGSPKGAGAFAVATANIGSAANVTFAADTGNANLPVTLLVCQTDPSGQCQGSPAPSVTTTIGAGATPTFSVFALGNGSITFDPAVNRIFARFKDAGSVTRGETSVAVTTE